MSAFTNNDTSMSICMLYSGFCFQDGKNNRLSLQVLQPAAGDKENLVGGSRQPVANVKVGLKLG